MPSDSKQRGKAKKQFKYIGPRMIVPDAPLDAEWLKWQLEIERGRARRGSEQYAERVKRFEHGPHPVVNGVFRILAILETLKEEKDVPTEVIRGLRQLTEVAAELLRDLAILRDWAARTAVRQKAAVASRRNAGASKRKDVVQAARSLLAGGSKPRELARLVTERIEIHQNRARIILQQEGILHKRSAKKKHTI